MKRLQGFSRGPGALRIAAVVALGMFAPIAAAGSAAATPALDADEITLTVPETLMYAEDTELQAETLSGLPVSWSSSPECEIIDLVEVVLVVPATGTGSCTLTATTDGDDSWEPATAEASIALTRRADTIEVSAPEELPYGSEADLVATVSSDQSVTWDATEGCTVTADTVQATSVEGTCTVTATTEGDDSWEPATAEAVITLTKGTEELAVSVPSALAFGASGTLSTTSDRAVSWSVTGGCSRTNATVRATTGVGTCTVTATAAADDLYEAAETVRTITLSRAANAIAVTRAGAAWTSGTVKLSAKRTLAVTAKATSKLKVTVSVKGPCKLAGSSVRPTAKSGTCTLTFVAAADNRYVRAVTTRTLSLTR